MTYSDRFQSRNLSIDAIAGFFIILMMFQHFNINTRAPYTLGHIFMFNTSWFFFKAGMFHRPQKLNKGIILKWSKRFLVPFMNFSVIGCLMQFIVEQSYDYDGNLLNITYGMLTQIARYGSPWWNIPVWFLLTLFFVKILTLSYSGGRTSTCVFILVTIVVALFHHSYIKNDFNYIGNTALATLFYILGFKSTKISISKIGYIAIGIIFLASILIIPSVLDIWSNSALYGNYFLAILGAGCGMLLVNKLFDICNFLQIRPLTFVGQNAMVFLICHVPIALAVRIIMLKDGTIDSRSFPWIEAAVSIPVCLAVCIFFDRNRPFRWIIGG